MNINWEAKSLAFRCIDTFSLHKTLYFVQKNLTRRSRVDISTGYRYWLAHQNNLATLVCPDIFEFGAGKNLSQNIFLSQYFRSQTVVDLYPMLNIDLMNDAASQISNRYPSIAYKAMANISELEQNYNIRYIAPFDAANTPFDDNTFDGCISTDTLEHIPEDAIISIFKELRRIIRPGGLISAVIDYSDHYSYTDRNIGPLNYLQYSTDEFKKYNHNVHYQNRLRHYDYARLFDSMGFRLIKKEAVDFVSLPARISSEFDQSEPSLRALRGIYLLQNTKVHRPRRA